MSKVIRCPACGNKGDESVDDANKFELKGQIEGQTVRKCMKCGVGLILGWFGKFKALPIGELEDGNRQDNHFLVSKTNLVGLKQKKIAHRDEMNIDQEGCAIYARNLTSDDWTKSPNLILRRYASQRKWHVFREYTDDGIGKTEGDWTGLNWLMHDAREQKFDVVLVWSLNRFARSIKHLVRTLEEFQELGIHFVTFQEQIDTSSLVSSEVYTIISAVAKLEGDIVADRVKAGLRRARISGKHLGRPEIKVNTQEVLRLRSQGESLRAIAGQVGISHTKVSQILSRLKIKSQKTGGM